MKNHGTIREVRETRKKISERFGHDPKRLVEYYKIRQMEKMKIGSRQVEKPEQSLNS